MFSNRKITASTKEYSDSIHRVKELLQKADAVIIGAGLSGKNTVKQQISDALHDQSKDDTERRCA